jgi:PilZ domain
VITERRRKRERVEFQKGFDVNIMGIDGTWRRTCILKDVSVSGARLIMQGSIQGLILKEFFLLLSSSGLAYRRCELVWVNGDQIGVNFLTVGGGRKKLRGKKAAEAVA